MTKKLSLDALWDSTPHHEHPSRPEQLSALPEAARRYLEHAIAPGTSLASAVRLRMHGEIKLKGWLPFTAEQVIRQDRGMIWRASVRMRGLPVRGFDRILDGAGEMRWKLLGLIPVMTASGPDISRSAAGRLQAEHMWLPSALCLEGVSWSESASSQLRAAFTAQGHPGELTLTVDGTGRLESVKMQRWGNPEGDAFHAADFGGIAEAEGTFSGYTIPTRLRVGWYFGTDRFASEGEFFRVTIDDARFR